MPDRANRTIDISAVTAGVTSPAWAGYLSQINAVLTFVSLVIGLVFMLWRWRRAAAAAEGAPNDDA